jgi:lipopolysaccharide/colanic/teichoic acid biosynthesis glycosyltransferase
MKSEQLPLRILTLDLAWIPLALAVEQALRYGLRWRQPALSSTHFLAYAGWAILAWILLSENLHLDGFRGGWRLSSVVSHLLLAVLLLMALLLAGDDVSAAGVGWKTLGAFSALMWMGFLAIRALAWRVVLRRYRSGHVSRVVILGSGRIATELAAKFKLHPELLCEVVGFLSPAGDSPAPRAHAAAAPLRISTIEAIALLLQQRIGELVLAHTPASGEILNLVAFCRHRNIRVSLVPQPYELYLSRPQLMDLGGLPLLVLGAISPPAPPTIGKRLLDLALGLLLGVATLPLVLACGAALRWQKGQAFRWESRVGQHGKHFPMLRLNVPRAAANLSPLDALLLRLSISELPQFWNVLRGEMSLVGPRPEGPERANHYSSWQQQRLTAKPGMTGLAQVYGMREQHSSEDKTRLDLQYMLRSSWLVDLSLLVETIWTLAVRLIQIPTRKLSPGPRNPAEGEALPAAYSSNQ